MQHPSHLLRIGVPLAFALLFGPGSASTDHSNNPNGIYSSVPQQVPANVASEGPEAYAFRELGDGVVFTAGAGGIFDHVRVVLSSWGCTKGHWYSGDCVTQPPS